MNPIKVLLAGNEEDLVARTIRPEARWIAACAAVAMAGCVVYGATFGLWRGGTQAFYTAVKFPLVVVIACGGNALLNGSLALVLGSGLGFRQSGVAILMSFTIMGVVLAAFAPLMLFLLWNAPSIDGPEGWIGRRIMLLAHVAVIALAGVIGNRRLWQLLRHFSGSPAIAYGVLFAWLGGNLLLGSQISWILRPWIGRHSAPISFFSPEPLRGGFFDSVWRTLHFLLTHHSNS